MNPFPIDDAVGRKIVSAVMYADELKIELDDGRQLRVMATQVNGEIRLLPVAVPMRSK